MRTPRLVAFGLILVLLDFRVQGFDVVPDLPGWGLVLGGLGVAGHSIFRRGPNGSDEAPWAYRRSAIAAAAAAVLSLADLWYRVAPRTTTSGGKTVTTQVAAPPGWQAGLLVAYAVTTIVCFWALCSDVADQATRDGDPERAKRFRTVRTAVVGTQVAATAFGILGVGLLAIVASLGALAASVWLVASLLSLAGPPRAAAPPAPAA